MWVKETDQKEGKRKGRDRDCQEFEKQQESCWCGEEFGSHGAVCGNNERYEDKICFVFERIYFFVMIYRKVCYVTCSAYSLLAAL